MAKEVRLEMNCDYCGHMLSDHAVNYYASGLVRVKCFLDSFVDEDRVRYYKCKCEDILIDMNWYDDEEGWDYQSPDEIIRTSPFKTLTNNTIDIKNDRV